MLNRRQLLKVFGGAGVAALLPSTILRAAKAPAPVSPFLFCLNTSTISGQKLGLLKNIEIASKAGYDGLELWINDIHEYLRAGNTLASLAAYIKAKKVSVFNAISFTTWMVDDDAQRNAGVKQLEEEMQMAAAIGCTRIAAPPMGVEKGTTLNFEEIGARYHTILELGRKYKVTPLLEFWGASETLYNLGQALAIAADANDADAKILPDVYHLFRGGSGFNGLKLVNGNAIDVIHMNDYPGNKKVEAQNDSDRVYPGDGVAPLEQVLQDLKAIGGTKILSLELFNEAYWKQDALTVATTGLQKMKKLVN